MTSQQGNFEAFMMADSDNQGDSSTDHNSSTPLRLNFESSSFEEQRMILPYQFEPSDEWR